MDQPCVIAKTSKKVLIVKYMREHVIVCLTLGLEPIWVPRLFDCEQDNLIIAFSTFFL